MSLRVEDSSVEKSNDGDVVDFIFSKDASKAKYDVVLVRDNNKVVPERIKHLLNPGLYNDEKPIHICLGIIDLMMTDVLAFSL